MRSRTSGTGFPLTAADISEADDWLIEHPVPAILMSDTTPSATSRVTTISSPHKRVEPLDPLCRWGLQLTTITG